MTENQLSEKILVVRFRFTNRLALDYLKAPMRNVFFTN